MVSSCLLLSFFFVAAQGLSGPLQALAAGGGEWGEPRPKAAPSLGGLGIKVL